MSDNRRIARNAIMLYLRMFLTMIVGLYTSRVVLATLGVEDYGIYGVVGGVVAMMGFLNASMSGATSRFLTFELGRQDVKDNAQPSGEAETLVQEEVGKQPAGKPLDRLAATFSSALIVHIGIAVIVLILAETVGLWFLCNKLVIPEGRMAAAHWVYQCSILSAMLGITQAPYNATIIAHEKMDVYAYVEILNVTLKLLIVYLLVIGNFDKLKLYAVLTLAVSVIIITVYRVYCIRRFPETRFHWVWDKTILHPLLSFSGWDLYGNGCVTIRQQGLNFLINMFFGVALNAASTIATIVYGVIIGLVGNVTQAFRPVIIKNYAQKDYQAMQVSINNASKFMLILLGLIAIPCSLELPYLFKLWLKDVVPEFSVDFCRILLVSSFFGMLNSIIVIGIHATGQIKELSIFTGSVYILNLPIIYVVFKLGYPAISAYWVSVLLFAVVLLCDIVIIKKHIPQLGVNSYLMALTKGFIVISVVGVSCWLVHDKMPHVFLRVVLVFLSSLISTILVTIIVAVDKNESQKIIKRICRL